MRQIDIFANRSGQEFVEEVDCLLGLLFEIVGKKIPLGSLEFFLLGERAVFPRCAKLFDEGSIDLGDEALPLRVGKVAKRFLERFELPDTPGLELPCFRVGDERIEGTLDRDHVLRPLAGFDVPDELERSFEVSGLDGPSIGLSFERSGCPERATTLLGNAILRELAAVTMSPVDRKH